TAEPTTSTIAWRTPGLGPLRADDLIVLRTGEGLEPGHDAKAHRRPPSRGLGRRDWSRLDFPIWEILTLILRSRHGKSPVAGMPKSAHTREYQRVIAGLRRAREAAGLTQMDVAGRLGVYA